MVLKTLRGVATAVIRLPWHAAACSSKSVAVTSPLRVRILMKLVLWFCFVALVFSPTINGNQSVIFILISASFLVSCCFFFTGKNSLRRGSAYSPILSRCSMFIKISHCHATIASRYHINSYCVFYQSPDFSYKQSKKIGCHGMDMYQVPIRKIPYGKSQYFSLF